MKRAVPILLGVFLLTGCGAHSIQELNGGGHMGHGAASAVPGAAVGAIGADFNPADVMFLQMMAPHNNQGVELARLAADRATRQEVKTLAAAIAATQETEAASMSAWLSEWKQPATAAPDEHAAHGGMPGASEKEIAAVANAAPADFEEKLLNMMIAEQDDAIQMARVETATGLNPQVKELAGRIDASRTAQIKQMLALLGQ
ncbi:DUF305 domain-containing protein [Streptosporangium sp. 'caverna']|uniref:DUF305 domain-containing protein n=1 Tax=Streptosporangium sp. 'caverna' TaxID=2202249 RepID=UPI000D7D5382|nr:DUF305 domain-containing protein [Streptosporangium sp. 'caverna']AWS46250.1 DUF305 domain-containing protein [Streptosporangium sp. 'caverna']